MSLQGEKVTKTIFNSKPIQLSFNKRAITPPHLQGLSPKFQLEVKEFGQLRS